MKILLVNLFCFICLGAVAADIFGEDGAADDMSFLGVDLSEVPEWDGRGLGHATSPSGCQPFEWRIKSIRLSRPFLGFDSMTLNSAKRLRYPFMGKDDWDAGGVECVSFRRSEKTKSWDAAKAREWLGLVAQTLKEMFNVDMVEEREGDLFISTYGECARFRFNCQVGLCETYLNGYTNWNEAIPEISYELVVSPTSFVPPADEWKSIRDLPSSVDTNDLCDIEVECNL